MSEQEPVMALRYVGDELDDVVVERPAMFRAEMMSEKELWMCCYFGEQRLTFWVRSKRGKLIFEATEVPPHIDWDAHPEARSA